MDSLDPADWSDLRTLGHRMVDDMIDHLRTLRDDPVWQPMPPAVRQALRQPLPRDPSPLPAVYQDFQRLVQPYATGNLHPRFMGWVHGGGNPVGMLAELLSAGLNANLGGRDHAPIEVERQVIAWAAEMLGFPDNASGVLVTGSSMANLIGVLVARTAHAGSAVRQQGVASLGLVAYASAAAHGCLPRAMEIAGMGRDSLRPIPCDDRGRMRVDRLRRRIARDRAVGLRPFLVAGTAGTVDTGAVDDLAALADVAAQESLWFHVDGAFGATALLAPALRPLLAGIERADSVAFDFHKWAQVPYDAGCIVVRDAACQIATFGAEAAYLRREQRGLAGGEIWPCDLGPDLSRGFRALKVWMTLRTYGADALGQVVQRSCGLAAALAARVDREPELERLAPVTLNIVCEHCLLPLSGRVRRSGSPEPRDRRGPAGVRYCRAVHHDGERRAGNSRGFGQSPDNPRRYRHNVGCGAAPWAVAGRGDGKEDAPGCAPGASIQGGFTSGKRRGQ